MIMLPKQNRSTYILLLIAGIGTVLFLLVLAVSFFSSREVTTRPPLSPTPFPSIAQRTLRPGEYDIEQSPEYASSVRKIEQDRTPIRERENAVGQLLHKLPYRGINFSLEYSYKDNVFTLTINQANRITGEVELNQFLITNKIGDLKWIRNLQTIYK